MVELHHFSDASQAGYGQCSYLRLLNESHQAHCSLVMGKSRVTPLKSVTIPRLELTAAVASVSISQWLGHELDYQDFTEFFWTDSGHAHGVGVHPLIINKCPTFSQIFLLWTECKRKQSQS